MALFRVRESDDEELLNAVAPAPENKDIQALIKLMPNLKEFCKGDKKCADTVRKSVEREEMDMRSYQSLESRIHFEIEDENRDADIPDYMYALEKFTNGDDCNIKVLRVDNEEK